MSFPRAPIKRFNEHVGCAPPPGTYEVKNGELKGAASFHRAERFKATKPGAGQSMADSLMSPIRRTMSADGLVDGSSVKREKSSSRVTFKHQKLLEQEIRSLVQHRGEQDRRLQALEEEMRKMEAKLLAAVREKTGLSANVASLERQLGELKKVNEFLKNKVSADASKKRINSLSLELIEARNKLDAKDKELSYLQISSEGQVKVLQSDLEASHANLGALQERNRDLDNLYHEIKGHNEELENEMDKLHAVIQELREEIKVLQAYLDTANEEIQCLRLKLQEKSSDTDSKVVESLVRLEELEKQLEQHVQELLECQNDLEVKKQELQDSKDACQEKEKQLEQCTLELQISKSAVGQQEQELARLRDVLRRTEEELDQRVALLGERCVVLEQERGRTQEEGLRRVEELKAEICSLQEKRRSDNEAHKQLLQSHAALKELLEEEKSEMETERRQLEAELEEALDELSQLEAQEQRDEEAIQRLEQENQELVQELKNVQATLERKDTELASLEERHLLEMRKLEEEHSVYLRKIGELASELESNKKSMSELQNFKDRCQELEEEVKKVTQELEKCHGSQDMAKEEYTKVLLDAQTKLDERGAELKKASQGHNMEVNHLKDQVEQERKEKKELQQLLEQERLERQLQKDESLDICVEEIKELRVQVEHLEQEKQDIKRQMEEEKLDLQKQHAAELQKSVASMAENLWKERYEELYAKVKPFQEQLDNFAAERDALMNENGATQEELNRLADAYARLLGHQNQRQKIKHIVKLKEENISLKQEVSKQKTQITKQKKELDQLKALGAPRKFDRSKAFRHESKENQQPSEVLREGN
ncbi:hyaluronan mediated motility receptor isoform X2 [Scleropages formosus]|uniref:hyaluronan mediated motility receptor isoform X2 n=1 Tax=Scleropages formosus TaxID=113540 RepID=UPI0010FA9794|nr:hyaluronan mediated motility receptor isoform X2 [Scleropages formosus]